MKNKFKVDGEVTTIYIVSKGETFECFIDTKDLAIVGLYSWWLKRSKNTNYAMSTLYGDKKTHIHMHRLLAEPETTKEVVDHINYNGLDNRRSNLRVVSQSVNLRNQSKVKGVQGVNKTSCGNYWRACVSVNNEQVHLGNYPTLEEACAARYAAEKVLEKLGR